jgi:hypothetical protein
MLKSSSLSLSFSIFLNFLLHMPLLFHTKFKHTKRMLKHQNKIQKAHMDKTRDEIGHTIKFDANLSLVAHYLTL